MKKKTPVVELDTRVQPTQKRAAESVEKILLAASTLLENEGLDAMNTNRLAEYADVRVRTIYRYFPNKFSVLAELAHRCTSEALHILDGFAPFADPALSLENALEMMWSDYLSRMVVIKGFAEIRHACRIYPELQSVRIGLQDIFTDQMIAALEKRGLDLPQDKAWAAATLFIETSSAIMDFADHQEDSQRLALLGELRSMQLQYLQPLFSQR